MSRSRKDIQPHWRPNFVNPAGLPDIKVIRTDFIINSVAVVLMLLVGFYVLQREYRTFSLGNTIAGMKQQILVAESDDALNLKLSGEFKNAAAAVAEVEKFFASPFLAHTFLVELAELRPDDLIFKQISVSESVYKQGTTNSVLYRINISGDVRSLTVLDEFKGKLSDWETLNLGNYTLEIDENLQGRNVNTGIFPYTLEISLRPSKAKPGGKGS